VASGEYPQGDPVPIRATTRRVKAKGATPPLDVRMETPRTTSKAGGGNLSSHEVEMAEKARKAMELRAAGATYAQIADRLGYSGPGPVYGLIKRHIAKMTFEGAAEMRVVQLDRLHTMLMSVWPKVVDPSHPQSLQAVDRALSITDRITKMYGLDASLAEGGADPSLTVTNSITVGGSTAEVMAALKAMAATRRGGETILEAEGTEVEPEVDGGGGTGGPEPTE